MGIKIASLNGNIKEEIYIHQPIGLVSKVKEDNMCHPKRSIYDHKQSSRSWYLRFY